MTAMNDIENWLLEDSTPEIKYRTMVELQGRGKEEPEVQAAYQELMRSDLLASVLDKFQAKSKWEHINALLILAELGLTREDVQIDDYVEQLLKKLNAGMKCARILMLRNLVVLGYENHPEVQKQITEAFATVREDGSVRCLDKGKKRNDSRLPDMGCYRQTTTYLLLAAELQKHGIVMPQYEALKKFYLDHEVLYHDDDAQKVIVEEIATTYFPIDHVHIGIQLVLYGLSVLGVGKNKKCQRAWDLLQSYQNEDGKYILSDSFQNPYFDVGAVGEPNKWVTLYALLAERYSVK